LEGKAVAVEVAKAGQSYHPDSEAHQKIIERAVQLELRRESAIRQSKSPLAKGLTEETRAILLGDSDTDESSDNDDEAEGDEGLAKNDSEVAFKAVPTKEKLTRAQRNKQKRLRSERKELEKQKLLKKRMNQVGELPRFKKELKRKEKELEEKRQERLRAQEEARKKLRGVNLEEAVSKQNPITAPTVPVTLDVATAKEGEVTSSSLRTLRPKGDPLTERMLSWRERGHQHLASIVVTGKRTARKKARKSVKGKRNAGTEGKGFSLKG